MMALGLDVDFRHQRAGGVQEQQFARAGVGGHGLGHAVGRKDDRAVVGAFVQLLDEDCAHRLQPFDDVAVMHDLMTHIDRSAESLDRPLNDLDRPIHPGAKAARRRQTDGNGAQRRSWGRDVGVHARNLVVRGRYRHLDKGLRTTDSTA